MDGMWCVAGLMRLMMGEMGVGYGHTWSNLDIYPTRPKVEAGQVAVVEAEMRMRTQVTWSGVHIRQERARDGKAGPGRSEWGLKRIEGEARAYRVRRSCSSEQSLRKRF